MEVLAPLTSTVLPSTTFMDAGDRFGNHQSDPLCILVCLEGGVAHHVAAGQAFEPQEPERLNRYIQ